MNILLTYSEEKALLKINGAITAEEASALQEKFDEVLESDAQKLEIDLSECHTINSVGVSKLLTFYKEFIGNATKDQKTKKEVEISKCSQHLYELFTTIKLNQLIAINL